MKAPGKDGLARDAPVDFNEIAFLVVAVECRVKLPLGPFVQRVLSGIPLHPLHVSLPLPGSMHNVAQAPWSQPLPHRVEALFCVGRAIQPQWRVFPLQLKG